MLKSFSSAFIPLTYNRAGASLSNLFYFSLVSKFVLSSFVLTTYFRLLACVSLCALDSFSFSHFSFVVSLKCTGDDRVCGLLV